VSVARAIVLGKLIKNYPQEIFPSKDGFMTPNKELKLPLAIKSIALIAAESSDGRIDFMASLINNQYGLTFKITTFKINVQGENAEKSMHRALKMINISHIDFDVAVIARGGGSPTSFMPFNSYDLSEEIAFSKIPIITGIGHATDVSVADRMAHTMTMTPTKAAEFIVAHNLELLKELMNLKTNIVHKAKLEIHNTQKLFSEEKINIYQNTQNIVKLLDKS
jgi:exodeoxyribonuclease VII large subunit